MIIYDLGNYAHNARVWTGLSSFSNSSTNFFDILQFLALFLFS